MEAEGHVQVVVEDGVATIEFAHPKGNSMPGRLLERLASTIEECGDDGQVRVMVLRSAGDRAFCAGASFDELRSIDDMATGRQFFLGFARVILALIRSPKLVIARVQGKAVGGGVGLAAAADYVLAHRSASIRLSELALGIGPFVIGPVVERKLGVSHFAAMSIDTQWRDADWALGRGLYHQIYEEHAALEQGVVDLARRLANANPEAMRSLKRVFWSGTDDWKMVMEQRAAMSGSLVLSPFTREYLAAFAAKKK